ncbi:ion channel [Rubritalea tangerina]|uniref:Ion channel n=1 Tax=Rubritalea tangerina TaxID=430798 RepID=A0ABW4Z855_9BACT
MSKRLSSGFSRLLVILLIYIIVSPFIPANSIASTVMHVWLSVVLFFAARTAGDGTRKPFALVVLGPALILYWLGIYDVIQYSRESALILFVGFYALILYSFVKQLWNAKKVTGQVIAGSLCTYLIIGLLWGAAYNLIYALDGGAYSGALLEKDGLPQIHIFNYFSLVTLTSLGYGDITPQSLGAASLCQMEAIIGQFYTAVLVAWLVGMYGKPLRQKVEAENQK